MAHRPKPAARPDNPAPRSDKSAPRSDKSAPRLDKSAPRLDKSAPRLDKSAPRLDRPVPRVEVRSSPLHGLGVFAAQRIARGTRIIEYLGERVSHAEADRRYQHKDAADNHTFLFIVDARTVIDAGVDGNEARFVNHACEPNCESVIENRRVFVDAIRTIEPGEELTYDYQIQRDADDPPDVDAIFACHCGTAGCRGTMLWPPRRASSAARRARRR